MSHEAAMTSPLQLHKLPHWSAPSPSQISTALFIVRSMTSRNFCCTRCSLTPMAILSRIMRSFCSPKLQVSAIFLIFIKMESNYSPSSCFKLLNLQMLMTSLCLGLKKKTKIPMISSSSPSHQLLEHCIMVPVLVDPHNLEKWQLFLFQNFF